MAASAPAAAEALARAALLDPFGLSAFFEQTQHWTPAERNTQLLALAGNFLLNRLLWTGGEPRAARGAAYRLFRMRLPAPRRAGEAVQPRADGAPATARPPIGPGSPRRRPARWAALRSTTRLEFRAALRSRPFLALMALWVG